MYICVCVLKFSHSHSYIVYVCALLSVACVCACVFFSFEMLKLYFNKEKISKNFYVTVVEFLFKVFFLNWVSEWVCVCATHLFDTFIYCNTHSTPYKKNVCILPINYQFGMNIYTFSTAQKVSHTTKQQQKVIFSFSVCVCIYSNLFYCYCCWFRYFKIIKCECVCICIRNEFLFAKRLREKKNEIV